MSICCICQTYHLVLCRHYVFNFYILFVSSFCRSQNTQQLLMPFFIFHCSWCFSEFWAQFSLRAHQSKCFILSSFRPEPGIFSGAMVPFLVYPFVNSTLVKKPQFKAPGIIGCFAILSSLFFYTLPIGSHPILAQSVVVILTAVILGFGQTLSDRSIFSSRVTRKKNSAFLCYACSYLLVQSLLLGVWAFLI